MKTINNNIQEARVGFPNAKLLKEKGFNVKCKDFYNKVEVLNGSYHLEGSIEAPTQQLAIDWIRINFDIQIFLDYTFYDGFHYGCKITIPNGDVEEIWTEGIDNDIDGSDTPEEAKEAAINYVLTKLI